jgi:hypothetical protein
MENWRRKIISARIRQPSSFVHKLIDFFVVVWCSLRLLTLV